MIKFTCSDCLNRVAVAEEHAGKVIDCPHCTRPVRVPVEGGAGQIYRAPCPSCGQVNNLGETDLGVKLSCGACGQGFVFGEEIARELKRKRKEEAERKKQEERAIVVRKKAEAERERAIVKQAEQHALQLMVRAREAEKVAATRVVSGDHQPAQVIDQQMPVRARTKLKRAFVPLTIIGLLGIIAVSVAAPQIGAMLSAMESPYDKQAKETAQEFRAFRAIVETGFSFLSFSDRKQGTIDSFSKLDAVASANDKGRESYTKAKAAIEIIWDMQTMTGEVAFESEPSKKAIAMVTFNDLRRKLIDALNQAAELMEAGK